jgi:hypothetical protein
MKEIQISNRKSYYTWPKYQIFASYGGIINALSNNPLIVIILTANANVIQELFQQPLQAIWER